jgi:sugar lactone lactonase YvrE
MDMRMLSVGKLAAGFVLVMSAVTCVAQTATSGQILVNDAKSQPESLTVTPRGTIYVGSASSPFVYRVKPGMTAAEKFIDASAEPAGTFFFGMLADESAKTLWTCQLTPVAGAKPGVRKTALRSFDLNTGAPKLRWDLPGESNVCNDFSFSPDGRLFISDTSNGRIYTLARGAKEAKLFLEDTTLLKGIDGITWLDGKLYVNNVGTSKIYRIPFDAAGKPAAPVEITLDQPVKGPDGMRAGHGKLFVAENGGGKISMITLHGDAGTVTVLKDGLKTPTGVEPRGDTVWYTERAIGLVESLPMPK